METIANLLGLIGVILLAGPAFYAAEYGSLVVRARAIAPVDERLQEEHQKAIVALQNHQGEWRPFLGWCLKARTSFAGASYLILFIKSAFVF